MKKRKNLVIMYADGRVNDSISDLLKNLAEEVTVVNHRNPTSRPDLLIFTGGEDVHPSFYNEQTGAYTQCNIKRDNVERDTFDMYYDVPKLGICRGSQFLTVMSGGKLAQHVENHGNSHTIENIFGGKMTVTSTHHQMMYPFNIKDKSNYELIAWSEYFRSKAYLNGDNKEIDTPNDFLEPEVVYYKPSQSLCIQGHPEFNTASEEFVDFTLNLIKKYIFNEVGQFKNDEVQDVLDAIEQAQFIPLNKKVTTTESLGWHTFNPNPGIEAQSFKVRTSPPKIIDLLRRQYEEELKHERHETIPQMKQSETIRRFLDSTEDLNKTDNVSETESTENKRSVSSYYFKGINNYKK